MISRLLNFLILIFLFPSFVFGQNASFFADTTSGCAPFIVNFNNLSNNGVLFNWDFGDGNQSQLENPSNTFTQSGFYTVRLIVSFLNTPNDTLIYSNYIEVIENPSADFQYVHLGSYCEADNVFNFQNNSSNATDYTWDFGDGNTSNLNNPSHSYNSNGTHVITLVAHNSFCHSTYSLPAINIHPIPNITANVSDFFSCDSNQLFSFTAANNSSGSVSWSWNFGDGTTSSNSIANHQYNSAGIFHPYVSAVSGFGCADTLQLNPIEIFQAPTATLTALNNMGCEPFNAEFNFHSNGDSIVSYDWDFGTGPSTSSSSDTISFLYSTSGAFNPNITATDINGCSYQVNQINPIIVNPAPSATYSASNTYGCSPLTVQFFSSTNAGNTVQWNFGDDTAFVNSNSPSHTYSTSGIFFPQITVTDSLGCSATFTLDTINSGAFAADFTSSIQSGCAPLSVDFTPSNSGATNWFWDFGDGQTSTQANPNHVFNSAGSFDVSLVIWNSSGCIDTTNYTSHINTYTETINLPPTDSIISCSPFSFNPNIQNLGLTNYQWDFGDGTTGSGPNPLHVYQNSGTFNAQLTASSPNGCLVEIDDFAYLTIDGVNLDLDVSLSVCDSSIVTIDNNSTGIANSLWLINGDTLTTNSIDYQLNSSSPTLIEYYITSNIGCQTSQYIPILFDCDSTNSIDSLVITPPLDTMPMNSSNPGSIITYVSVNYTCGPEQVNLISPFTNAQSFYWMFGDGGTSNDQNPSHLYNSPGIFHLIHYALDANGDTSTLLIDYFITQHVAHVDFDYSESFSCDSSSVTFNSLSSGATSWLWNFGNGNSANTSTATFTFPLDNTAEIVSLTVTDTNGCSAIKSTMLHFYKPIIDINQDTLICFEDTLNINAQTNSLYSYNWDMGDGNSYSTQFVEHEYLNPGVYSITLNVTDQNGCVRNIPIAPVNVFHPISTFSPNTPQSICVGESIEFTSDNQTTNSQWWYFPQSRYGNPKTYTYNSAGTFDVTHRVKENGCIAETTLANHVTVNEAQANFSYTQLNACFPITVNFQDLSTNAVSWNWNFGDGMLSTVQNPHHNFNTIPNNDITLTITDNNGCSGSHSLSSISTLSNEFNVSDTVVCVNSTIQFDAVTTMASNWFWDFGDGQTATTMNPTHQYVSGGTYDVTLVIDDGLGCIDTLVKQSLIEVQEVVAQFTYSSPSNCPPVISSFTNSSTGASNYLWYFGDGSTSTLESPAHIYTAAGNYNISLVASNDIGCSDSIIGTNPILIPGPVIDFSIDQLLGCDTLTINLTNTTSSATSYLWNFGNGDTSTIANPSYTYLNSGSYVVTLTAFDTMNCVSFMQYPFPVEVIHTPTAQFTSSAQDICIPNNVSLLNSSTNATDYLWAFNNQSSTSTNPTFSVNNSGNHTIELIAFNQGCSDTATYDITGHFVPAVNIVNPSPLCANEGNVLLHNSSILNNNNINWSINGSASTSLLNPSNLGGTTVTVIASTAGFCPSSDTIEIVIIEPEDASIVTNNLEICEGDSSVNLAALNPNGIWSGIQTNPITGVINSTSIQPGSYTITYTINTLCFDTDSIELTVLNQPDATILTPGVICSNEIIETINSLEQGGVWSGNHIHPTDGTIKVQNLGAGFHDFVYSHSGSCPASDTIEIEITPFLAATIEQPRSICEGDQQVQLTALNPNGIWSGIGISDPLIGKFNSSNLSSGVYTIYYQTNGLCNDLDSTYMYINPTPEINFEFDEPTLCLGSEINIVNQSSNIANESFEWFLDDSLVSTQANPSFNLALGGYFLTVHVMNQYGCKIRQSYEEALIVYDTTPLPAPEIIRSTVINDQDVYTEWAPKQNAVNTVKEYVLFKSLDQQSYDYLGTFNALTDSYIDEDVDVFTDNYTYYVVSINQCNVPSSASNISSSVLLGYEKPNEFQTILRWTSYEKWKEGVNRYEVQKLNEYGQWDVIKIVNHNVNNTLLDP